MSIIISSTTSEDKDLVWEKDEKGNHTITLYQLPKKGDGEPKKIKSMNRSKRDRLAWKKPIRYSL